MGQQLVTRAISHRTQRSGASKPRQITPCTSGKAPLNVPHDIDLTTGPEFAVEQSLNHISEHGIQGVQCPGSNFASPTPAKECKARKPLCVISTPTLTLQYNSLHTVATKHYILSMHSALTFAATKSCSCWGFAHRQLKHKLGRAVTVCHLRR